MSGSDLSLVHGAQRVCIGNKLPQNACCSDTSRHDNSIESDVGNMIIPNVSLQSGNENDTEPVVADAMSSGSGSGINVVPTTMPINDYPPDHSAEEQPVTEEEETLGDSGSSNSDCYLLMQLALAITYVYK
ncbi:hypothetical protein V6N11_081261 [Hibiscus sabdariffa]|uniref:Uncharacterized protein n=1 Tax=Hibiscus sabdariffa TaxID=183260 RepID=A0ABR2QJS9_9ROSI